MPIYYKKQKTTQPKPYMSMTQFPKIEGFDFNAAFDLQQFLDKYLHMGFQGSHLGRAFSLANEMMEQRKNGLKLWLSFTGNMISSGNRDILRFLAQNKMIDGIVTSAASIEEDIIKCIKPFHLGSFDIAGKFLHDECVGRIGNILAPYDRYSYFEQFFNDFFECFHEKSTKPAGTSEIIRELGLFIQKHELTKENHKESLLFWAAKNDIPIFCPAITDGALGDMMTFFKRKHEDFVIDITQDNSEITLLLQNSEQAGCIILGGGVSKHFLLNAAIFREGFEYSIYLTTAQEFDGSDSGGNPEEAISWAKIKPGAQRVKVVADATITFPLLAASIILKQQIKKQTKDANLHRKK